MTEQLQNRKSINMSLRVPMWLNKEINRLVKDQMVGRLTETTEYDLHPFTRTDLIVEALIKQYRIERRDGDLVTG